MIRKLIFTTLAGLLVAGITPRSLAGGDEVVVIYNSQMPESEALAYDYARKRNVPKAQIFGFKLVTTEEMSRNNFRDDLQRPLAKELENRKLWRIGSGELPGTNGKPVRVTRKVVESKIRYAVLCYGVPLKILRDPELHEPAEETLRPEFRRNQAAVDSELACLPLNYSGYTLAGPHANPLFRSLTPRG